MVGGSLLFLGLFDNLAVFIVLVAAYSYLNGLIDKKRKALRQMVMGLVFGTAALICMQVKIPVYEGVVVDQRNAIVILAGAFSGPITGLISTIIAGSYRIYLGGMGVFGGCLGLALSAIAGSFIFYNRKKIDTINKAALASVIATAFVLPGFLPLNNLHTGYQLLQKMAVPYGSAVFLGVFLTGLLLALEEYRYKIKSELKVSEKRYRELFESLIDVSFRTDCDGKIEIISPSCKKKLGYSPNELSGKKIEHYFKDAGSFSAFHMLMNKIGSINNFEVELKKRDGTYLWVSINARKLLDEYGEPAGFEAIARDISQIRKAMEEKKQLQKNFVQIQKMESIGTLAGGIAHDFNNSLSGIIGGAELLQDETLSADLRRKYLDLILSSAEKAGELTRKLLAFSRKDTTFKKPLDIVTVLSDTVEILRHTIDKRIVVEKQFQLESAFVTGDGAFLQNVFMNLGINAAHAMSDGGRIVFSLSTVELTSDYCELSPFELSPGTYVEISVRDNGRGMTPEVIARIFEPFFTTKEPGKGTGLGLAAVYGTIQDHNGAITVYSEIGQGTVFHVYLPFSGQKQGQPVEEQVVPHGSGTILIVDDEELVQTVALTILSKLGYKVLLAENGKKGIEIYKEHRDEIRLVILDMIMPVMGGRETFLAIHKLNPLIPVVISSGFSREDDLDSLKKLGVSGFLRKPFHRVELAGIVAKMVYDDIL